MVEIIGVTGFFVCFYWFNGVKFFFFPLWFSLRKTSIHEHLPFFLSVPPSLFPCLYPRLLSLFPSLPLLFLLPSPIISLSLSLSRTYYVFLAGLYSQLSHICLPLPLPLECRGTISFYIFCLIVLLIGNMISLAIIVVLPILDC